MKKVASYFIHSSKEPEVYLIRFLKRLFKLFLNKERLCHVALAGGKTPLDLYRILSKEKLLWDRLRFYLSDERYVPLS